MPPVMVPEADSDLLYRSELLGVIQARIDAHPRSHQKMVGPSEIGGCETKLAFKLAYGGGGGGPGGWAAAKGSVLHNWLDEHVFGHADAPRMPDGTRRFYSDLRLSPISPYVAGGTLDLFDRMQETIIDFKLPGEFTTKAVRNGQISAAYFVQAQVYGLELDAMGEKVSRVGLLFLPMAGDDLHGNARGAILRLWPFDRQVGLDAIANVERIKNMLNAAGPAKVLEVLDRKSDFCSSCPAFLGNGDRRATCPGIISGRPTPVTIDPANPFARR